MRKTASRFTIAGVMAAALALGLTATAVKPASAAVTVRSAVSALAGPTCHGTSCVGHDPAVYGCSASNTAEQGNGFATVWGEFSNNCDAKWAQGQLTPQSLKNHYTIQVAIGTNDDPESEFMCYPGPSNTGDSNEFCTGNYGGSSVAYTDMVYGHLPATAIVYVYNATGRQIDQISVNI